MLLGHILIYTASFPEQKEYIAFWNSLYSDFITYQHIALCSLKAHLHHYLHVEGMEQSFFSEAVDSLSSLIEEYHHLDATKRRLMPDAPRLPIAR